MRQQHREQFLGFCASKDGFAIAAVDCHVIALVLARPTNGELRSQLFDERAPWNDVLDTMFEIKNEMLHALLDNVCSWPLSAVQGIAIVHCSPRS